MSTSNSTMLNSPNPTSKHRRLFSLTDEEMMLLIDNEPAFVFEHLPWKVVNQRPDWVATYHYGWMVENYTGYMLTHHTAQLAVSDPDILFKHDPNALRFHNKKYLIDKQREWVVSVAPDLLGEVSRGWITRAHYSSKNRDLPPAFRWFYHLYCALTFPWRKHGAHMNPYLTQDMVDAIQSTPQVHHAEHCDASNSMLI